MSDKSKKIETLLKKITQLEDKIDKIEEDRQKLEKVNKNMNNDIQELKYVIKRMGYNWNKN